MTAKKSICLQIWTNKIKNHRETVDNVFITLKRGLVIYLSANAHRQIFFMFNFYIVLLKISAFQEKISVEGTDFETTVCGETFFCAQLMVQYSS